MMTLTDSLTVELIILTGQLRTVSIEREILKKRIAEIEKDLGIEKKVEKKNEDKTEIPIPDDLPF